MWSRLLISLNWAEVRGLEADENALSRSENVKEDRSKDEFRRGEANIEDLGWCSSASRLVNGRGNNPRRPSNWPKAHSSEMGRMKVITAPGGNASTSSRAFR